MSACLTHTHTLSLFIVVTLNLLKWSLAMVPSVSVFFFFFRARSRCFTHLSVWSLHCRTLRRQREPGLSNSSTHSLLLDIGLSAISASHSNQAGLIRFTSICTECSAWKRLMLWLHWFPMHLGSWQWNVCLQFLFVLLNCRLDILF